MGIYYVYKEDELPGEPLESGPWATRSDGHVHHTPCFLQRFGSTGYEWRRTEALSFPENLTGPMAHVVLVKYYTGDTFGRTYGLVQCVAAYDDENEAYAAWSAIKQGENGPCDCPQWKGYFEGMEDCWIQQLPIVESGK